jgi:hypothetical protein
MFVAICFAVGAVGIAALAILLSVRSDATPDTVSQSPNESAASARLRERLKTRGDYRIAVGVPLSEPLRWADVESYDPQSLEVEGIGAVSPDNVKAFVVCYPSKQLVDSHAPHLTLPSWVTGLSPAESSQGHRIEESDLEAGNQRIAVSHGSIRRKPGGGATYSTTLKNIAQERIRVIRFAGYRRMGKAWQLDNVTGQFYSAEEYRNWYGLTESEWIAPGEAVTDPDNYGGPKALWAYLCETESGERFLAGAITN